jgi:predicted RNA-binding protein associated with RNAse of E/G family
MYQPDAIAAYRLRGKAYYVTANEGDSREAEEARVKDLALDSAAFPNGEGADA